MSLHVGERPVLFARCCVNGLETLSKCYIYFDIFVLWSSWGSCSSAFDPFTFIVNLDDDTCWEQQLATASAAPSEQAGLLGGHTKGSSVVVIKVETSPPVFDMAAHSYQWSCSSSAYAQKSFWKWGYLRVMWPIQHVAQ